MYLLATKLQEYYSFLKVFIFRHSSNEYGDMEYDVTL